MLVVHVHVYVLPEVVDAFKAATIENARNSVQEPGIARFDVIQDNDDPTHFVLNEVYRSQAATVAHKETAHYALWRDTVAPMMAKPRTAVRFANVYPADEDW
jgi:(4S)-4-hydroxy-5-phosphonooxypentane-2,3-dione isomerase